VASVSRLTKQLVDCETLVASCVLVQDSGYLMQYQVVTFSTQSTVDLELFRAPYGRTPSLCKAPSTSRVVWECCSKWEVNFF